MSKQKSILKTEIINTIITLILGILLHFTYKWSNNNPLVGLFSPINESTWEHLKLLFFPILITTIISYFYTKSTIPNYLCLKTKSLLLALSFIIIFFYTYTGIIGTNISFLNIASFFLAVFLSEYYTYHQLKKNSTCSNLLALITIITFFLFFIIFTFNPPYLNLFKDPLTNTYGIKKAVYH